MLYERENFEIMCWTNRINGLSVHKYAIRALDRHYLHSDGRIFLGMAEYWPTREHAEEILDKYYPKPAHVWVHGDVFRNHADCTFVYVTDPDDKTPEIINMREGDHGTIDVQMRDEAKPEFLFNIKDKL